MSTEQKGGYSVIWRDRRDAYNQPVAYQGGSFQVIPYGGILDSGEFVVEIGPFEHEEAWRRLAEHGAMYRADPGRK